MTYTKQTWTDGSGGGTPLSATRLNYIETGIEAADKHVRSGAGTPEGSVTAPVGELYTNTTDGSLYTKQSGTGNTGWVLASGGTDGTRSGTGSPEGVVTAPTGDVYTNTTNGDFYAKTSGTGNTGWTLKGATGAPGTSGGGYVLFSSFSGADDDAKLATAITYLAGETYKPSLVLDENRAYTFNDVCPDLPHGFHMTGPVGSVNGLPEQAAKELMQVVVNINYSGVWVNPTTEKWNIRFSNLNFEGTSTTTFCNSGTATAKYWQMWNLSFNDFLSVIGLPGSGAGDKYLTTGLWTWGYWDVANCHDTAFHLGGADANLFQDGMFLDSGETVTDGTPHFWADNMQKSVIGPIYCTARLNWTGLYVSGSMTNGAGLSMSPGARWEGMNTTTPCRGATIRVDGGALSMYGASVNYGMSTTNGRSDAGVIHHAGGDLVVRESSYARTSTVSQDVPFIYSSGGRLYVSGIQQSTYGGSSAWTDLPVVSVTSGGNLRECDSSVRVSPIKERDARVYTGASAPTNPQKGDLWIDAGAAAFQIWSGSAWGTTRVS